MQSIISGGGGHHFERGFLLVVIKYGLGMFLAGFQMCVFVLYVNVYNVVLQGLAGPEGNPGPKGVNVRAAKSQNLVLLQSSRLLCPSTQESVSCMKSRSDYCISEMLLVSETAFNIWQCAAAQECAEMGGGLFLSSLTDSTCDLT